MDAVPALFDPVEIRRVQRRNDMRSLVLVLTAVGIGCVVVPTPSALLLYVETWDAERARAQLDAYERENRPRPPVPLPTRRALVGLDAALAYAAVLTFFFAADTRHAFGLDWSEIGAAIAGPIREGAWWRTVTALTLHADFAHLAGNMIAGGLISLVLSQILGPGLAWAAILLSGALGNGLNILFHAPDYASVGASTALFGALGILSGHLRRRRVLPWRGGVHHLAPIGGGVLLLAFLGFGGERTDVGAHMAGFAVGLLLGWLLAHFEKRVPEGPRAQWAYAGSTVFLIALAWALALHASG
ncbi:MAG: rhomboid family intramembrane serine protease [Geminicoccaceae bacterium]